VTGGHGVEDLAMTMANMPLMSLRDTILLETDPAGLSTRAMHWATDLPWGRGPSRLWFALPVQR